MRAYRARYRFYGLAAGLALWQLLAVRIAHPLIIPRLEDVAVSTFFILTGADFAVTVTATLLRIAATIVIDTAAAFILGFAAGLSERVEAAFTPFETGMRAMPTMGLLLLSLIWFNSEITPVFVASLIAFPLLYRGVVNGVKNIDTRLIQMSAGFRVPLARKIIKLYIPSIQPFTLTAYSTALGLLVKVMVTAEVLSQPQKGIGTAFQIARAQLDTAAIFGWSIIVIAIAAAAEQAAKKLLTFSKPRSASKQTAGTASPAAVPGKQTAYPADTPIPEPETGTCRLPSGGQIQGFAAGSSCNAAGNAAAAVRIEDISFRFDGVSVFESYSLRIEPARINCLFGKSGRGKTTLLFLIAGFLHPQKGRIRISPPDARIGFAYQDIRLIPHLTAAENIAYILPPEYTKKEAEYIAAHYLRLFGLSGFEHFFPHELSGGMQRRVSLVRALAYPCTLLLLDEAFDSLDGETKKAAAAVFSCLAAQQKQTVLCVTHDPVLAGLLNAAGGITLPA
ncbi:MAG: ATP-binding cassette domain-containing protein [Treponema sp.]